MGGESSATAESADRRTRGSKPGHQSAGRFAGPTAIGFGVSATVLWNVSATLESRSHPDAGNVLHGSVLIGLIATASGALVGLLIDWIVRSLRQTSPCRPSAIGFPRRTALTIAPVKDSPSKDDQAGPRAQQPQWREGHDRG